MPCCAAIRRRRVTRPACSFNDQRIPVRRSASCPNRNITKPPFYDGGKPLTIAGWHSFTDDNFCDGFPGILPEDGGAVLAFCVDKEPSFFFVTPFDGFGSK